MSHQNHKNILVKALQTIDLFPEKPVYIIFGQ
jgi:hypothetical protein